MMIIEAEGDQDLVASVVEPFVADCRAQKIPVLLQPSARHSNQVLHAAGPVTTIVLQIDPATLKLLFEYGAALIVLAKGKSIWELLAKAATEKTIEIAGSKIGEAMSRLWLRLVEHVGATHRAHREARVYLRLAADMDGTAFSAEATVATNDFNKLSSSEIAWLRNRAALELVAFVMPVARKIAEEAVEHNRQFREMRAQLLPREDDDSGSGQGNWKLDVDRIATLSIEPDGSVRGPAGNFSWNDIPELVTKMVR